MLEIVQSMGDVPDAAETIARRLGSNWSAETIKRYVGVARKLGGQVDLVKALSELEYHKGRDSALDGITALRSLMGLNLEEADAVFVATRRTSGVGRLAT